ncbi:Plug domain-containing protein [Nostoc sp. NMS7]|uniref:Plug domain-containing protein n=1 Tax=Nostoc sp. NMS7 TaxID=2815391 RepID=UPI0025FAE56C|nr:Plug domain-containing protein [Nostoc sp. NMS7]
MIPQQVIKDQQVTRLDEALRNVSGVTFAGNNDNRGIRFSLRGFGAQAYSGSVPVLRDGFRVYGSQGFPELSNLERVEVLKDPASILYGEIDLNNSDESGKTNFGGSDTINIFNPVYGSEPWHIIWNFHYLSRYCCQGQWRRYCCRH